MSMSASSATSWQPHPIRFNFRRWIHRPYIKQDWGERQEERKVSWGELFCDLFSVASTTNVTHLLIRDPTGTGAGRFLLLYCVLYFVWSSHSMLVNRFDFSGLLFDSLNMVHHLALLGMILAAQNFDWYARFAGSYAIVRVVSLIYHLIVYASIPRARPYAKLVMVHYSVLVALAWAAACTSMTSFTILTAIIVGLEAGAPLIYSQFPKALLPLHVEHMNERIGLIMMIFLGETIIQLGITPLANTALQYAGIAFGAISIFCLHLIYYHNSPDQHDHAMRQNKYRGMAFYYCHVLLGASFLLFGSGLSLVLATYVPGGGDQAGHRRRSLLEVVAQFATPAAVEAEATSPAATEGALSSSVDGVVARNVAWIVCAGYSASLFFMLFIRMTHYLHFDRDHPIHVLGRELNMTHYLNGWWAFGIVWPFAGIFIAFAAGSMGATAFLGYLCAHAVLYNLVETYITHTISSHPRWMDLVVDSHHGSSSRGMHKSSSQGSLGTASLGAGSMEMVKPSNPEDAIMASDHYLTREHHHTSKDADVMETGGAASPPVVQNGRAQDVVASGANRVRAGGPGQGVAVGNDNRGCGHTHRTRSGRVLGHTLSRKKCEAWVDCSML